MQVKSISCRRLQGEHSAILLTFIKLPFVIKTFVLSSLNGILRQVLLYPACRELTRGQKFHSSARNYEWNLERTSNSSQSTCPVGRVYRTRALGIITWGSRITYYSLMFFIAYAFKGHVHAFAGRVKVVSHSSCRTSAIFSYFCPLLTLCLFDTYSALFLSSSISGTSLCTRIPRFILAGSRAQLDIPMNATWYTENTHQDDQRFWDFDN